MAPVAVFAAALAVYLRTAPRGLTWLHDSADGGDLIVAALVGGVPHPTGYPTFTLLAQFFTRLPWGTPAWRVTLLSALAAALAAALVAATVQTLQAVVIDPGRPQSAQMERADRAAPEKPAAAWLGPALAAGLVLAFTPLLWGQATVVEVYALQACLTASIVWALAHWLAAPETRRGRWRWPALVGLLLGLAVGNHLTAIWLLPLVVGGCLASGRRGWSDWRPALSLAGGLAAGLLVYAYLPLAASGQPPVNWGDPSTPQGFWWLVSGQLYRAYVFAIDGQEILPRLQAWIGLLGRDFLPWGLALALAGLALAIQRQAALALSAVLSLCLGLVWAIGYDTSDSALSLLPGWVLVAVFAGLGLSGLAAWLARRGRGMQFVTGLLCLAIALIPLARNWTPQDIHADRQAEDFLASVLQTVQPDALVITAGDRATFSLWYARYGLERRPDIIVVSRDLWQLASYRATVSKNHPPLAGRQPPADLATLVELALAERTVYLAQQLEAPDPATALLETLARSATPAELGLDNSALRWELLPTDVRGLWQLTRQS